MSRNQTPERTILHVDMDAFFVAVEEVRDPSLKGKPVIVGGDPDGRGVVSTASYAARRYGVHSAMPMVEAKRRCPHAIFLRVSQGVYGEFSRRIFNILRTYSPLVEPVSLDEAYMDLSGCERLHGPVLKAAESIRREIRARVGITASIGIAVNKLLAKVASDFAKPNGLLWIAPGKERKFLCALPIHRLPGVGRKGGEKLTRRGIRTVGQLAALPRKTLEMAHGKWGTVLHFRARGVCVDPVLAHEEDSRSIGRETTFAKDVKDPLFLEATLSRLVEEAAAQLRASGLFARSVTLKLRTPDFTTRTRSCTLNQPASEDPVILQAVLRLFRRTITPSTRVRLIGVSLSGLNREGCIQSDLFADPERQQRLCRSIDRIRGKYGFRSIQRGKSALSG